MTVRHTLRSAVRSRWRVEKAVRRGSFAVHTVTAGLLIYYIWILEVPLSEGHNSLRLYVKGLQRGFLWLDKENQHMLLPKLMI